MGYSGAVNGAFRRLIASPWPCLVLALALYAPFLGHPFQYDDEHTIVANTALREPDAWRAALTGSLPSSAEILGRHYRPLTHLTYWATIRIGGPSPVGFHAVNLGLHVLVAWLVMVLARELTNDRRVAVLAGGLFALHPAVSEAVLYASARATVLSSLFMLASLGCFVRARQRQRARRPTGVWWAGWAVSGLAALLAKESAVALPLLCLAADAALDFRDGRARAWHRWAPHVASLGALLAFAAWLGLWRPAIAAWSTPGSVVSYLGTVAGQFTAIGAALRLFVVPWPVTVDHPLPAWPGVEALILLALAGACAAMGAVGLASRRPRMRLAGFLGLWVVIVALPTTLWPLNVPFQEHRAYLQHAGLAIAAALGAVALRDANLVPRRAAAALALAVAAAWGWLIVEQGRAWSDPVRLWDRARHAAPGSFRAHANAGLALASAGRWLEADAALAAALEMNPDYPPALTARGALAQRAGKRDAARADYERAVARRADYVPALFNLGLLAHEAGDPAVAEAWYRRALAINPLHSDGLLNLGVLLLMQERIDEADAVFASARSASPGSPEALYYSGVIAERRGRAPDAEALYLRAQQAAAGTDKRALAAEIETRIEALGSGPLPRRPAAP